MQHLLIIGAMCTYFKTKKSQRKRKISGKDKALGAESRKRQHRHNASFAVSLCHVTTVQLQKAHARMKALQRSTTIDDTTK